MANNLTAGVDIEHLENSQVDYAIYWPGNVDVWLDYVRLDDVWAHFLFTDPTGTANGNIWNFHDKIHQEVVAISALPGFGYFYLDEYAYNNYPCIAEVNKIIKSYNLNTGLVAMDNEIPAFWKGGSDELKNKPFNIFFDTLYSSKAVTDILINETYPFRGGRNPYDRGVAQIPAVFEVPYEILPSKVEPFYHQALNNEEYNFSINGALERNPDPSIGTSILNYYDLGNYRKGAKMIKKAKADGNDITVSMAIQTHSFESTFMDGGEYGLREPTNEEISLLSYLALIYGVKQIMDFSYTTYTKTDINNEKYHDYGLLNEDNSGIREFNYYGQAKWNYVCNLNAKLRQIGEILYPINQPLQHLVYDTSRTINTNFQNEHPDYGYGLPFKFISDITSLFIDPYGNFPDNNADESAKRYWEAGTFLPPSTNYSEKYSRYFIMLNKRCTPSAENVPGDVRTLKLRFNAEELPYFNNWVLTDPITNTTITTINKNSGSFYNVGLFQPGEGKLFKLAPVMQEGGTFVCDEHVSNTSFVCKAPVNTGGYKLELFSENSGQSVVTFRQGSSIQGETGGEVYIWGKNNSVELNGAGTEKWTGIIANDIDFLRITNAIIRNITPGWAVSAYNVDATEISDCRFYLSDDNVKAINVNNAGEIDASAAIYNNIINVKNPFTAVYVGGAAGSTHNLFLYDNTIQSTFEPPLGVLLSNITSCYFYNNNITGFKTGLKIMSSTLDLESNYIYNNGDNSVGIHGVSSSTVNMGVVGDLSNSGMNNIQTHGNECRNILLENSIFQMDCGVNEFEVNLNTGSYNMYGNGDFPFSGDGPVKYIEAKENCFNGEGNNAIHYLTDPNGYVFSLHELPHTCGIQQDMIVDFTVYVSNTKTDTVYKSTDSSNQNLPLSKILYRNFYKNYLKKYYDSTISTGFVLLSNFADSTNSTDVIAKLYFAASKSDTTNQKIQQLKTFYEQLILNNTQNILLIKTANYYIQKCKVPLHQYTSALAGFQDIIVQNPYSYEGLLASWDYAATLLLANSGGAYSNKKTDELNMFVSESQYLVDSLRMNKLMRNDSYNSKLFSKEERKTLIKSEVMS
ncbi:MAG: hypothetical protein L0Y76_03950 [Ignavibacteria bacterium]|nr:hypothetical protein [Ignavibacteria bacterium]